MIPPISTQSSALPQGQDPAPVPANTTTNVPSQHAAADEPPADLLARLGIHPELHNKVRNRLGRASVGRDPVETTLHRLHWMNFLNTKIALFMMPVPKSSNERLKTTVGDCWSLEKCITRHATARTECQSLLEQDWAWNTVHQEFPFYSLEHNLNEVAHAIATVSTAVAEVQEWLAKSGPDDLSAWEGRLKTAQKDLDAFYAAAPDYLDRLFRGKHGDGMRRLLVDVHAWRTWSHSFYRRLLAAIVGGLALVAPMLIMVLHPTLLTTVITSVAFVITVGGLMAMFMSDAQPKDIVSASAAYAAVVVVFVGATLESEVLQRSTLSNGAVAAIAVGTIVGLVLTEVVAGFLIVYRRPLSSFRRGVLGGGLDSATNTVI